MIASNKSDKQCDNVLSELCADYNNNASVQDDQFEARFYIDLKKHLLSVRTSTKQPNIAETLKAYHFFPH